MATQVQYQYLEPRPRSHYRQLWVKGRHLRAEVLYRCTVGVEPRTPEEVAQDYESSCRGCPRGHRLRATQPGGLGGRACP